MIIPLTAPFGSIISLDFRKQFGERVELECFHFVVPPIEFRLLRNNMPLQEWQQGNIAMYDLQHGPGSKQWCRDGHWFINDLDHRHDVATCGVLSQKLRLETRGLGPSGSASGSQYAGKRVFLMSTSFAKSVHRAARPFGLAFGFLARLPRTYILG